MNKAIFGTILIVLVILGVQHHQVLARPNINIRTKRLSDSVFSHIQTQAGLRKVGVAITMPVASGRDLDKIGRKRRSQSRLLETLFNQSDEDRDDPRDKRGRRNSYEELLFDYK
ncbi:hypothetical protein ABEB36_007787 [Hypothenemus hampei]|uniref:Uncharacterized protein n=1 Tax=Hypothenemus hampei TaxID=57062 RepID=A0ABD1EV54_HYPHA